MVHVFASVLSIFGLASSVSEPLSMLQAARAQGIEWKALTGFNVKQYGELDQDIVNAEVEVPGLKCGGEETAWLIRPEKTGRFPLIAFGHGAFSGGEGVAAIYKLLLTKLAARGYMVLALLGGGNDHSLAAMDNLAHCQHEDMWQALKWARQNKELNPHLNLQAGTALMGHSMGAVSALLGADPKVINQLHLKTVVAINPHSNWTAYEPYPDPGSDFPMLVLHGSTEERFAEVTGSSAKMILELNGGMHGDVMNSAKHLSLPFVFDWVDCKLKGEDDACFAVKSCDDFGDAVTRCSLR